MEMGSRRAVAAVSFAVRFSPEIGLFAVVLFGLYRCRPCLATAGSAPAADLFDPAAAAAVVVVDLSGLSAAGLAFVAAGPGFVGSAAFAADLACSACFSAVALGRGTAVVAVPFYFLTPRSSF
jgi:hypothetical protein